MLSMHVTWFRRSRVVGCVVGRRNATSGGLALTAIGVMLLMTQPAMAQVPGPFGKSSPANGAVGQPTLPALSWGASALATSYEYCINTSATCPGSWTSTGANRSVMPSGLLPGTTYYWQVAARNASGTTNADTGTWWSFTTKTAPANDRCGNAAPVVNPPFTSSVDAGGATKDPTDPPPYAGAGNMSVWYRYTARWSGPVVIDTFGSGYDTVLTVYTGGCGNWTRIGGNDDAGGTLQSRYTVRVTTGVTYAIMVTSYGTSSGQLSVTVRLPATPGDFDGDGETDVLWWQASRGDVWIWPMVGTQVWDQSYVTRVPDLGYRIVGVGDFDGDGKADILWHHAASGEVWIWLMDGSVVRSATYLGAVSDTLYEILGVGDFNADGKADILWHHATNGQVWIWLMNGTTVSVKRLIGTVPDVGYQIVGVGDFDGEGTSDIVWRHATNGEVWMWRMGGGYLQAQTHFGDVSDQGYRIVAVGDFDGDGNGDILWHHAVRGEVWIWSMNGPTQLSQSYVGSVPDVGYEIMGVGDFDADGKADILWHHASLGEVYIWLMDATTIRSVTQVAIVSNLAYQIRSPR